LLRRLRKADLKNLELMFELPNLFRIYPQLNRLVFKKGFLEKADSDFTDLGLSQIEINNSQTSINLSKNKVLKSGLYLKLEDEVNCRVVLNLQEYSKTRVFVIQEKTGNLNLEINLEGREANVEIHVLSLLGEFSIFNLDTISNHKSEITTSKVIVKSVLDDSSKFVFLGRIRIEKHSEKSVASLLNKNIILSDKAKVETMPELEILASDVKCSHGASVGGISPEILCYLQTRGIGPEEAKNLVIQSYISEIVNLSSFS